MPDLKTDLLKIANDLPTGDPTRRQILAALVDKEAGRNGQEVLDQILDRRAFM